MPRDPKCRLRDAHTERRAAAAFIHSHAMAVRGRGWSGEQVVDYFARCAQDIAAGAHVADPHGDGRPA